MFHLTSLLGVFPLKPPGSGGAGARSYRRAGGHRAGLEIQSKAHDEAVTGAAGTHAGSAAGEQLVERVYRQQNVPVKDFNKLKFSYSSKSRDWMTTFLRLKQLFFLLLLKRGMRRYEKNERNYSTELALRES